MKAALYARYSTDLQSAASVEDQFRVCERLAERHGFSVTARYCDRAISGGTANRPGYQDMLAAARRREFAAIIAEDSSRLWRNMAEQAPRLAELSDLGVVVVTHDLDTRSETAEILGGVLGALSSQYRKEIGRRTRRGLEGKARAGKSAGGRSYGYIPASASGTGQIEVDAEQAATVRRIFQMFADGHSARSIAATLNCEGIPSPGATWNRERRRAAGWTGSAIHNNPARGLGILANDLYRGVVIWNRSRWIRSAADSNRRRQVMNPESDWIVRTEERLRIVSDDLWQRVRARQQEQTRRIGERVRAGLSKPDARRTGAGPKYLLSGLLRCAECGSAFAIVGREVYGCSGYQNGGKALCGNNARLRRPDVEREVTAGLKRGMASPAVIDEICRRTRAALRSRATTKPDNRGRIATLETEIRNLTDAIAGGLLRASPALAARLAAAEADLGTLQAASADPVPRASVTSLLADLPARARRAVEHLEETLSAGDLPRAREEIRSKVGTIEIEADEREIRLFGDQKHLVAALARANGTNAILYGSGGRI